jgi:hypothetical protein
LQHLQVRRGAIVPSDQSAPASSLSAEAGRVWTLIPWTGIRDIMYNPSLDWTPVSVRTGPAKCRLKLPSRAGYSISRPRETGNCHDGLRKEGTRCEVPARYKEAGSEEGNQHFRNSFPQISQVLPYLVQPRCPTYKHHDIGPKPPHRALRVHDSSLTDRLVTSPTIMARLPLLSLALFGLSQRAVAQNLQNCGSAQYDPTQVSRTTGSSSS